MTRRTLFRVGPARWIDPWGLSQTATRIAERIEVLRVDGSDTAWSADGRRFVRQPHFTPTQSRWVCENDGTRWVDRLTGRVLDETGEPIQPPR